MNLTCTFVRIQNYTGFEISAPVICEYLKEMNFSRQCCLVDISSHICLFSLMRLKGQYGYSIRGKTPQSMKMLIRGEHLSVIAIMTINGVLDFHV